MFHLFGMYKLLDKKNLEFFKIQIFLILFFGISYYLAEQFNFNYFEKAQKMRLIKSHINFNEYNKPGGLDYYLWFSTVTQSTVGYAGVIDAEGNTIPFEKINSNSFVFLNFCQLISILLVPVLIV